MLPLNLFSNNDFKTAFNQITLLFPNYVFQFLVINFRLFLNLNPTINLINFKQSYEKKFQLTKIQDNISVE